MLSAAKCRSLLEDLAVIGTKHLLFLVESKKKQILRFAQDDTAAGFFRSLLRRGLSYLAPSELSYAANLACKTLRSNFLFPISSSRKVAQALATAFVTLANTTALFGQSCAMCYNTAAAAKAAAIQALRSGILILLVPVALMFIGIFILAFRSKERFTESDPEQMDRDQGLIDWSESMPLNCRSVSQCVSESAHSPAVRLTN